MGSEDRGINRPVRGIPDVHVPRVSAGPDISGLVFVGCTRNQARDQTRVSKEPAGLDFEPAGLDLEPAGLELKPVGLELEPAGLEFGPKLA